MCLTISQKITDKIMNGPEEFYVYKFLYTALSAPYQDYYYKAGWNKAKGRKRIKNGELYGGALHVLLRKPRGYDLWYKVVRLKARKKDLVAAGYYDNKHSAGFKKLYLEQDQI